MEEPLEFTDDQHVNTSDPTVLTGSGDATVSIDPTSESPESTLQGQTDAMHYFFPVEICVIGTKQQPIDIEAVINATLRRLAAGVELL